MLNREDIKELDRVFKKYQEKIQQAIDSSIREHLIGSTITNIETVNTDDGNYLLIQTDAEPVRVNHNFPLLQGDLRTSTATVEHDLTTIKVRIQ